MVVSKVVDQCIVVKFWPVIVVEFQFSLTDASLETV